jgi:hypothetical protein
MIRSVSDIREPTTARGRKEIASAASQPVGSQSAGSAIRQTGNAVIGPANRRKISCQAGGSISSGLNHVWSLKISKDVVIKNTVAAANMIRRAHSGSSVAIQDGIAISTKASGISKYDPRLSLCRPSVLITLRR